MITGTGTHDTDREVLYFIDDYRAFTSLICSNKHWSTLCSDKFWYQKLTRSFGCLFLKYQQLNCQKLYHKLIRLPLHELLLHASSYGLIELFTIEQMRSLLSANEKILIRTIYVLLKDSLVHRSLIILNMAQNAIYNKHFDILSFLHKNKYLPDDVLFMLRPFIEKHAPNMGIII